MRVLATVSFMMAFCFSLEAIQKEEGIEEHLAVVPNEDPYQGHEERVHSFDETLKSEIKGKSSENAVFHLCRRLIVDVCSCQEINEGQVFEKISELMGGEKNIPENLGEIIDDFQEINANLIKIFSFVSFKHMWDVLTQMGVDEKTSLKVIANIKEVYYDERALKLEIFKIVRESGSGVHWKDMAKYQCLKEFISGIKNEFTPPSYNTKRYETYLKIVKIIMERRIDSVIIERVRDEFIRELCRNRVEKEKVLDVMKNEKDRILEIYRREQTQESFERKNLAQ